jgi:hypothetical protein
MAEDQDRESSGINNFSNDGSFMESFMKLQQEKKPEVKVKAKPLPPIRKPLIMKMGKRKKPPLLAKSVKTVAVLEPKESHKEQASSADVDMTEDVVRKGEMLLPITTNHR